jgi:hypothetical protein
LDNQESSINLGKSDFMTACKVGYVIGSDDPVELRFTHHFSLVTLKYQTDSQPLPFVGIRSGRYTVKPFRLDEVAKGDVVPLNYEEDEDDLLIGMSPVKTSGGITTYQAIVVPQNLTGKPLFYTLKNGDDTFFSIKTQGASPFSFDGGNAYTFSYE